MSGSKYSPKSEELTFLGFRLSAQPEELTDSNAPLDLEKVLFKFCLYLQEDRFDGRLASVMMSWMKVHGGRVHVDRLRTMRLDFCKKYSRDVLWLRYFAYYNVSLKRYRWQKLTEVVAGANAEELRLGSTEMAQAQINRWGLEPFLPPHSKLKVHKGALRVREEDVLDEQGLMRRNPQYRNRFRFGANARCDVVTHMESNYFQSVLELSRFLGLSREAVRSHWEDNKRFLEVVGGVSAH